VSLRASPLTSHHMAPPLPARIRRSYYILAFLLQGLISAIYVLISSMITWKFPDVPPFVVNEGLLLISIIAYAIMCIGFPLLVIFIVDYKDFRDSTLFQLLSAWIFLAVIVAPIGLGCVIHTPAEYQWIGYAERAAKAALKMKKAKDIYVGGCYKE
nr:hypothetical protein [Tanacetum cinerariifolium]